MGIIFKSKLNSTNLWGKEHIDDLEDKTVVYTDFQTNGRGRLNRKWESFSSENLYASIILKPNGDFSKLPISNLTQLLSVVITDVLRSYKINAYIKWPNDVIVDVEEDGISGKKICGILAEVVTSSNKIKGIVLGFGLNINATDEELKNIDRLVTSMFIETFEQYSAKEILEQIVKEFFSKYDDFMGKGFNYIKEDYLSKIKFIDKKITINMHHKTISGIAKSISEQGAILIENNKELSVITMGEIE